MADLPTGTVTFLFTDLEGSTRLWEQYPDAMKRAMARHDEVLRDAIAAHDGHVVKMRGDGVHAVFADARRAVAAAVDGQRALTSEAWSEPVEMRVRVGIHTGPADVRDGDYYGTAVNKAARLMSAANGGQIVVSLATEELVRDVLQDDVVLEDLGEHRFRDLSRPERVFGVGAPGLTTSFPSLHSLDSYAGNLPVQLTSFIGRDEELQSISTLLDESRMVTITGVGGVGKTRLAMHVAAEVVERHADGVWLCELAGARDEESFAEVVTATLGAQPRPGLSLIDSTIEYLRGKNLLLVLDNCEHLVDVAGPFAEQVLRSGPSVRILATSREGLAVAGEQVWPLRSLTNDQGSELFSERARSVAPTFMMDAGNASAIAEVCRRLDGIPLAIELAAARTSMMSPADIAARLDERFRLLTGGRRTAVERHQTLRATVDWSYSLLEERDRVVFERLGVFSGGFDERAAEAVASGEGIEPWDVFDALGALIGKSLVVVEETSTGSTRYALLETLRQYAVELLDARGATDAWRRRHSEYFATFAEELGPGLLGRDELDWRARFRREVDNLRAAIGWSLDSGDPSDSELAVRIVAAIADQANVDRAGTVGEWAQSALAAAERSTPGRRVAVTAAAAAAAVFHRSDYDAARDVLQPLVRAGVPADCPTPSLPYIILGITEVLDGRPEFVEAFQEGHRALDQLGGDQRFGHCMLWCFAADCFAGWKEAEALTHARAALRSARELGNPSAISNALFALGWSLADDDPNAALAALDEAFTLAIDRDGMIVSMVWPIGLSVRARILARRRAGREALIALKAAFEYSAEAGDHSNTSGTLYLGLETLVQLGMDEPAAVWAGAYGVLPEFTAPASGRGLEELEAAVDLAHQRLGDERFEAAFARGAAMSYDEIVDYALVTVDALIGDPAVADG